MCGIFFSLGFENLPPAVIDSVSYRGPDGRGWNEFSSPNGPVIMAHRRLAIIDLSNAAHQPMTIANGRYWITYNGEIYNYMEIRKQLEYLGHFFKTNSDTEVLLHSYMEWGTACLQRLNGMFAFVIWDDHNKTIFAARDRFGVKPLYFFRSGNKIALASEIKQILAIPSYQFKVNNEYLLYFSQNESHPISNTTFFDNILQIEPGHFLIGDMYNYYINQWYQYAKHIKSMQNPEEELLMLLKDSVHKRLHADVPAGALLSGGLDSSAIVCIIGELIGNNPLYKDIQTFTSWSPNPDVDEKEYSDAVIEKTGLVNHLAEIKDQSLQEEIHKIIYHLEEPFFNTSIHSEWNVFKAIGCETELKVVLDGQGSDELLCGYLFMIPNVLSQYIKKGRILNSILEFAKTTKIHKNISPSILAFDTLALVSPSTVRLVQSLRGRRFEYDKTALFSSFEDYSLSLLRKNMESLLRWQDRCSMAFSIESRQPFLDYRLVEFLLSLDIEHKFKNGRTKVILRESMKGILPEKVRNRTSKFDFPSPQNTLMKNIDKKFFKKYLDQGVNMINQSCQFKYINCLKLFRSHEILSDNLFMPFSLGIWSEVFGVSN